MSTAKLAAGGVTGDKIAQGAVDGAPLRRRASLSRISSRRLSRPRGKSLKAPQKNVLMTPFLTRLMVGAFIPPSVPPGTLIHYAGRTVPSGWLICNGANVSRTDYAALFAAIGTDLRYRQRGDNLWPAEFGRSLPSKAQRTHWFCRHLPLSWVTEHNG